MNQIKLYLSVFICGFVVMAFEIIGSRVLAPYVGASVFVWVSIIGVILLAMSGGYYLGGQRADRGAKTNELARLILMAATFMCLMNLGKEFMLRQLIKLSWPLLVKSTLGSLLLFSIPAFFLAAVFPYALRLALTNIEDSGKTTGRFYAISTLGSILGTFLSATVLIPSFGTSNIIWMLAALLMITALILFYSSKIRNEGVAGLALVWFSSSQANQNQGFLDIDTEYNRVWIYENQLSDRPTKHMALNGHVNSGMYLDDPVVDQVYAYANYFRLAEYFNPGFENALMLGAGAYSFPKLFQHNWPDRTLTVVEIDEQLTALSEEHFSFDKGLNTTLVHEDARTYLQRTDERFDVIFSDVFTSPLDVPFQLTTQECYQAQFDRLNDNGVLIVNVLGSWEGEHSIFLKSQVKTAQSVFNEVRLIEVSESSKGSVKNNMLIAMKGSSAETEADSLQLQMLKNERFPVLDKRVPFMTDDYAPANWLLANQR
ncbi:MAG: fused MFS/spermidine synthase [Flavobacteriales bacterium]